MGEQFFRVELADEIQSSLDTPFEHATPAIIFPSVSLEYQGEQTQRTRGVTVVGCTADFWDHASAGEFKSKPAIPGYDEIVLNQPLADELQVKVGDSVLVRLAETTSIAADSVLARQDELTTSLANLEVIEILPAQGLARFGLHPTQSSPLTAFVGLEVLQSALGEKGKCNAVVITGGKPDRAPSAEQFDKLRDAIEPTLADIGIQLRHIRRTWYESGKLPDDSSQDAPDTSQTAYEYFSLSTDRMLFPDAADEALDETMGELNALPVMTYSVNLMSKVGETSEEKRIPYSIVTAIDQGANLSPLSIDGQTIELADNDIVLSSWAADDMGAKAGDEVTVTFYEPETTHGDVEESSATFRVAAIVSLTKPAKPYDEDGPALFTSPPTIATDPDFTPTVEGVSDQDSIRNWDAPFPVDMDLIRDQDDDFWSEHRTTPKAFISLSAGRKLWGSRFGGTTSYRIPITDKTKEDELKNKIGEALKPSLSSLGFSLFEVKKDGLAASQGTTPFNLLFIGFSFFIIAAALMLVSLLFRLGMEQRSEELGIMLAQGIRPSKAASIFVGEGLATTLVACTVGVFAGVGYAWLMIAGLRSWWLDAVVTPFLEMHISPLTLLVGFLVGVLLAVATIGWAAWRMSGKTARQLIAGIWKSETPTQRCCVGYLE